MGHGGHGANYCRGSGHISLHAVHALPGFEGKAAAVVGQALAYQCKNFIAVGGAHIAHDNQPGRIVGSSGYRQERFHPQGADARFIPDLHCKAILCPCLLRLTGQMRRGHNIGGFICQYAGQVGGLSQGQAFADSLAEGIPFTQDVYCFNRIFFALSDVLVKFVGGEHCPFCQRPAQFQRINFALQCGAVYVQAASFQFPGLFKGPARQFTGFLCCKFTGLAQAHEDYVPRGFLLSRGKDQGGSKLGGEGCVSHIPDKLGDWLGQVPCAGLFSFKASDQSGRGSSPVSQFYFHLVYGLLYSLLKIFSISGRFPFWQFALLLRFPQGEFSCQNFCS